MVTELIERYRSLDRALKEAIRNEDDAAIARIDREIAAAFDEILVHQPANLDERLALAEFLLDFLDRLNRPSSLAMAARDKILKLVRNQS